MSFIIKKRSYRTTNSLADRALHLHYSMHDIPTNIPRFLAADNECQVLCYYMCNYKRLFAPDNTSLANPANPPSTSEMVSSDTRDP